VISDKRLERGHRDDRHTQYRPFSLVEKQLAKASPDLLRELLTTFIKHIGLRCRTA
jgi:hypothetical protein